MLYKFSMIFGYLLDLIFLICCLLFCYRKGKPKVIRILPFIAITYLTTDVFSFIGIFIIKNEHAQLLTLLHILFLLGKPIELIFFTYLLSLLIHSALTKKIAWVLSSAIFLSFIAIFVFHFISRNVFLGEISFAINTLLESTSMVIFCLVYFRQTFKNIYQEGLAQKDSFWLVAGVLFYFSVQIPDSLFVSYFMLSRDQQSSQAVLSIFNYLQIIPCILYINAITFKNKQELVKNSIG